MQPTQIIQTAPEGLIQFRTLIQANGVAVNHDLGIIDTPLKDLMEVKPIKEGQHRLEAFHPDLVEAAITSLENLTAKYSGVKNEQGQSSAGEVQQEANATGQEVGGDADEKAGQVTEEKAV
jgi:hypothetical protein